MVLLFLKINKYYQPTKYITIDVSVNASILFTCAIVYLAYHLSKNSLELSAYEKIMVTLGIFIAVHGMAHAYAEVNFGLNPLNWQSG